MNRQRFAIFVLLISLTMVLTLSIDRISVRASGELNTEPVDDYYIYLPVINGQPKPSSCTPDPAGESDNINDALTVCSGQTVSGQVSDNDWDDVYKILTVANQQLTLSMNGSGGDADLYLFPPGTSDVDTDPYTETSQNEDNNEYIQYTVTEGGFWYIDVFSYEGTINYNLTITLSGP
jgi:hypothetical protein